MSKTETEQEIKSNEPMTRFVDRLILQGLSFEEICDKTVAESQRRNSKAYDTPEKVMAQILGFAYQACYTREECYRSGMKVPNTFVEASKKMPAQYNIWLGWHTKKK